MRLISIIIPTFRRPDMLPVAVECAFAQKLNNDQFEIIAVDNSPEGSALNYLRSAQARSPVPMTVLHETRPGVAFARNTALAASKGELIAFLDDDTRCATDWLQSLVDTRDHFDAGMIFSPSIAEAPEAPPAHRAYIESLFTRMGPPADTLTTEISAASSSLHVKALVLASDPPFPLSTNDTGGEDDMVFSNALARGVRAAWAVKAKVFEIIPPNRANLTYAFRRSFAFGQGACRTNYFSKKRDYMVIARHMLVGVGQTLVFGVAGAAAWAINHPARASILSNAYRGAGKIFWTRPTHFYGAWMVKNVPAPSAAAAADTTQADKTAFRPANDATNPAPLAALSGK